MTQAGRLLKLMETDLDDQDMETLRRRGNQDWGFRPGEIVVVQGQDDPRWSKLNGWIGKITDVSPPAEGDDLEHSAQGVETYFEVGFPGRGQDWFARSELRIASSVEMELFRRGAYGDQL